MNLQKNKNLTKIAQNLRRNMTKEERHLWYDFLKNCPVQFNRQKVIGNYIVDFYCYKAKLVIELDGSQHFEDVEEENDKSRKKFLSRLGLVVLRIPNNEIWDNFNGVCETIDQLVKERKTLISQFSADSFSWNAVEHLQVHGEALRSAIDSVCQMNEIIIGMPILVR